MPNSGKLNCNNADKILAVVFPVTFWQIYCKFCEQMFLPAIDDGLFVKTKISITQKSMNFCTHFACNSQRPQRNNVI